MTKEKINAEVKKLELKKVTIETRIAILKTQLRKLEDEEKNKED